MSECSFSVRTILRIILAACLAGAAGCGGTSTEPAATPTKLARAAQSKPKDTLQPKQSAPTPTPSSSPLPDLSADTAPADAKEDRSFQDLAAEAEANNFQAAPTVLPDAAPALPTIDDERVAANGIRKISGERLTLYTDLPSTPAIDELPNVFAAAIPQWSLYFEIDAARTNEWRMVGYLIKSKERFRNAGLIPSDLPPFLHGYQRGGELWLNEQPSDYYRRHLLLHEGTHGFMKRFLGGAGPPWYMEGVAELLATHQWESGRLALKWFPGDKKLVEYWGRIKVIKEDYRAGKGKSIEEVLRYDARAHLRVEPYAWSWAVAAFFDTHPAYRDKFRGFKQFAPDTTLTFSQRFYDTLKGEWPRITREWQVYVVNMDYGYDIAREAIDKEQAVPLPDDGATVSIAADRGWQSSGFVLETGATYRIEASGRYQLADQPKIWWCEPNGVTIRYHRGRPLGMLLGAIIDEEAAVNEMTALTKPQALGMGGEAPVESGGTLFLRINDSPAELADNSGSVDVRITKVK